MRKAFFFLLVFTTLSAYAQPPLLSYQSVITGLSAPVDIVNAGDGSNRLFIVQQGGLIRMWNGSLSNFLNLGTTGLNVISTGGEQGLLSMAFHPDYNGTTNRYFFVYYTDLSSNLALARYQTVDGNPNLGDPASGQVILTIAHPGQTNHNGGKLNFGTDGHLYFATGDGGGGNDPNNNAQNGLSLLGKMIRINVDNFTTPPYYTVPTSNPFVGNAGFDSRIFDLGLRNPFRWSFDRQTGDMWIGDVGQGAQEEVNFRSAASLGGNNYGWRCFEGYESTPGVPDCTPANNVFPVYDYPNPPSGSSAVTGGYVYRGPDFPALRGYYIAADVYSGNHYLLWPNGSGGFDSAVQSGVQGFIVGFGEAEDGTLYAASQSTNTVYKLLATGGTPLPVTLRDFRVSREEARVRLQWQTATESRTRGFHAEWSANGRNFTRIGWIPSTRNSSGSAYQFLHTAPSAGINFYRLSIEDEDGSIRYSSVLRLNASSDNKPLIYPTLVTDGRLQLVLPSALVRLRILDSKGVEVYSRQPLPAGSQVLSLPSLPKGPYFVELLGRSERTTARIMIN